MRKKREKGAVTVVIRYQSTLADDLRQISAALEELRKELASDVYTPSTIQ